MGIATRSLPSRSFRTAGNLGTSGSPSATLLDIMAGPKTNSGVRMSARTAIRNGAVWSCVSAKSSDFAQLPAITYERTEDGRRRAREHPVYRLLHEQPNPYYPQMTPYQFKRTLEAHRIMWGGAYAEIEYSNAGEPIALWPLLPDRTRVEVVDLGDDGIATVVETRGKNGEQLFIPGNRVLQIPGLSYNGVMGYIVAEIQREKIALSAAMEEFVARYFGQGSRPSGIVKHPKTMSDEARKRLRKDLDGFQGLANAHRIPIFEEGVEWHQIGIAPEHSELLASRKFEVEEIARMIDIPLARIHHTEKSTSWGTGIGQFLTAYIKFSLKGPITAWEEAINLALLTEAERQRYYVEFLIQEFERGDAPARVDTYRGLFQVGGISPNEIAARENLPNIGPAGDSRFVPLNMIPVERAASVDEPAEAAARAGARSRAGEARAARSRSSRLRLRDSHRPIFADAGRKIVKPELRDIRKAIRQVLLGGTRQDPDPDAFDRWLVDFYGGFAAHVARTFLAPATAYADAVGDVAANEIGLEEIPDELLPFVGRYADTFAQRYTGSHAGQLRKIAREAPVDRIADELEVRLSEWDESAADKVGRREVVQLGEAVAYTVWKLGGVRRLRWITNLGACPICDELNGRIVGIDQPFVSAGESVGPVDAVSPLVADRHVLHAPLHDGCTCSISPA